MLRHHSPVRLELPRNECAVTEFCAKPHVGLMSEAQRIADLAVPFLDDRGPPRLTGFFEVMDAPPAPAPGDGNRQ